MRIALIASPFITVPPARYGGTELFVANLAEALIGLGIEVSVYTNGASTVNADVRWRYAQPQWPLPSELSGLTKEIDHVSWAISDSELECDIIHVNSSLAVPLSRFSCRPFVCTMHHPYEAPLTELYEHHSAIAYVSISHHQASMHPTLASHVIHHGLDISRYRFQEKKQPYLCFLGRICPVKGAHNAIEIAKRAGLPLKIAGEIQPIFRDYFETRIRPHIDGKNVEYVGEADFVLKNDLLSNATALLFPIEWNEPFGLVMIESMACGTPVIAFPGGAVEEVVDDGVSGRVCRSVNDAVHSLMHDTFLPRVVRRDAEMRFSMDIMAHRYSQLYSDFLNRPPRTTELNTEETAA